MRIDRAVIVQSKIGEHLLKLAASTGDTVLGLLSLESGEEEGRSYCVLTAEGIKLESSTAQAIATGMLLANLRPEAVSVVRAGNWIGTDDHGPHTVQVCDGTDFFRFIVDGCKLSQVTG